MAAPTPKPSITTITLQEESFVYSTSESSPNGLGAVFSDNISATAGTTLSLLTQFGGTAGSVDGYIVVKTVAGWINNYINTYKGLCGSIRIKSPDPAGVGRGCNEVGAGSTCFNGATGNLARHWWSVHNFMQYGAPCIIAGEAARWGKTLNPLMDKSKIGKIDVVFALTTSSAQANIVKDVVLGRGNDCFGIVGACGSMSGGYGEPSAAVGGQTSSGITGQGLSLAQYGMCVYGQKDHFGLLEDDLTVISTPLIADAAGCLIRTDRDFGSWWSPAGYIRGRILNVLRLSDQPTQASQVDLYGKRINYAITEPGRGSYLFSDRTLIDNITSPYRVTSVSRLLTYLVNTIGPLAKKFLFEFNNELTRTQFVNSATPVLEYVKSTGGLTSYKLTCDSSNNPEEVVLNNEFVIDIVLRPTTPITTITLRLTNANLTNTAAN